MIIRDIPKMVLKDFAAEVYEGMNGEFFIRVYEVKHESEVCMSASEAAAFREWLDEALCSVPQRETDHG